MQPDHQARATRISYGGARDHARISIALERQRTLADLRDGVGASLIGLLRHVQSGQADRDSMERRVREALREMRIAIDAWWPHEDQRRRGDDTDRHGYLRGVTPRQEADPG